MQQWQIQKKIITKHLDVDLFCSGGCGPATLQARAGSLRLKQTERKKLLSSSGVKSAALTGWQLIRQAICGLAVTLQPTRLLPSLNSQAVTALCLRLSQNWAPFGLHFLFVFFLFSLLE